MTRVVLTLDGVSKDLTDLDGYNILQKGSVYVDRQLYGPSFAPVIGTAEWQILWSTDILNWVDGREDETLVQVLDGTTPLFTGYLRPTTSAPLEGPADKVKMEALDTTVLLESTVEEAETRWLWTDAMKVSMASGANSMVHEYLKRTRLWTGSTWVFPVQAPDRDIVIPLISIARGDEAKVRLDKMCSQFGLCYYALEDGSIKFFRWDLPNPTSELTIGQAGINRKLAMDRKDPKEKGVIVQFQNYTNTTVVHPFVSINCKYKILGHNEGDDFFSKTIDEDAQPPEEVPSENWGVYQGFLEVGMRVQLRDHKYNIFHDPNNWWSDGSYKDFTFGLTTERVKSGAWKTSGILAGDYDLTDAVTEFTYDPKTRKLHVKFDGAVGDVRKLITDQPQADVDTAPNGTRVELQLKFVRFKGYVRYYEHLEADKANKETDDEAAPRFRTHPATSKKLTKEFTADLVSDRSVAESTAWARYHNMVATTFKASLLTQVSLGQVATLDIPMKGFSSLSRVVSLRTNPGGKALPEASFESLVPVTLNHVPLPIEPTAGDLRRSPDQIAIDQALEVALDPNAVTTIDRRYRRAATKPETPIDDEPENWVRSAYDGEGKLWMIEGNRNRDGQLIDGWPDPAQADGPSGKTLTLTILSGVRSHTWDASGTAVSPAATAFGVRILEDGVEVTPTAYAWSTPAAGLLSGSGTEETFTPTVASVWDSAKADNWVQVDVTYGGVVYTERVPVAVSKVGATGLTGPSPYIVSYEWTNGKRWRPGTTLSTTIKAHVWDAAGEVTSQIDASRFRWRRVSKVQPAGDDLWDAAHAAGYKQVSITVSSKYDVAAYYCDIISA